MESTIYVRGGVCIHGTPEAFNNFPFVSPTKSDDDEERERERERERCLKIGISNVDEKISNSYLR